MKGGGSGNETSGFLNSFLNTPWQGLLGNETTGLPLTQFCIYYICALLTQRCPPQEDKTLLVGERSEEQPDAELSHLLSRVPEVGTNSLTVSFPDRDPPPHELRNEAPQNYWIISICHHVPWSHAQITRKGGLVTIRHPARPSDVAVWYVK